MATDLETNPLFLRLLDALDCAAHDPADVIALERSTRELEAMLQSMHFVPECQKESEAVR